MGWKQARFFLILAMLALFLAGTQSAFIDASRDAAFVETSILAAYPSNVILETEGRLWRYKGRDAAQGSAFAGAASFAVGLTDLARWSRLWQGILVALGAVWLFWGGYYWPHNLRRMGRIGVGLCLLIVGYFAHDFGAWIVWTQGLPADGGTIVQGAVKGWVDLFMWVHGDLQARGLLG